MTGLAQVAMGTVAVAGGALLATAAGQLVAGGSDVRPLITQDFELPQLIPAEQASRRAGPQHIIDLHIAADERGWTLRERAASYQGSWRDLVPFGHVVLFAAVWWNGVEHAISSWLPTFVLLIPLVDVAAAHTVRDVLTAARREPTDGARTCESSLI